MWAAFVTFVRTWGFVVLLVAGGLAVAYRFVEPAPPSVLRLATGPGDDSAYTRAMARYAAGLRAEGFEVELKETDGSVENLAALQHREVDLALVQGGVAWPPRGEGLTSLGSVFFEPAWVFVRREAGLDRLQDVTGRRIAMGPEGSGTRHLAISLLEANGIPVSAVEPTPLTGLPAAEALLRGEVDVVVLVSAIPGAGISRLMRAADVAMLVDFETRAAAYATLLPFLTPVTLPRSGFSLPEDLPPENTVLMAPAAAVLTRTDIHPQVVSLMMRIMREEHRGRQMFAPEGRFPSALNQDVPVQREAQRWLESGPGFLQAWLPFRMAVTIERLWVLIIPLVTLALPLMRFAPPLYTWQMESRVWRHYDELRKIEQEALELSDRAMRDKLVERLGALERKVSEIGVPAAYARQVFALRRDIAYVRDLLMERRIRR